MADEAREVAAQAQRGQEEAARQLSAQGDLLAKTQAKVEKLAVWSFFHTTVTQRQRIPLIICNVCRCWHQVQIGKSGAEGGGRGVTAVHRIGFAKTIASCCAA